MSAFNNNSSSTYNTGLDKRSNRVMDQAAPSHGLESNEMNSSTYNTGLDNRSTRVMDQTAPSHGRESNVMNSSDNTGLNDRSARVMNQQVPSHGHASNEMNSSYNTGLDGPSTRVMDQTAPSHGHKLNEASTFGHHNAPTRHTGLDDRSTRVMDQKAPSHGHESNELNSSYNTGLDDRSTRVMDQKAPSHGHKLNEASTFGHNNAPTYNTGLDDRSTRVMDQKAPSHGHESNELNSSYNTGLDGPSTRVMDQSAPHGRELNENHGIAATGLNEPFNHANAPRTQGTTAERNFDHNDMNFSGPRVATNTVDQTKGNKLTAGEQPHNVHHHDELGGNAHTHGNHTHHHGDHHNQRHEVNDGIHRGTGEHKYSLDRTGEHDLRNAGAKEGDHGASHHQKHTTDKNSTSLGHAAAHPIDTAKNMTSSGSGSVGATGAVPVRQTENADTTTSSNRHHGSGATGAAATGAAATAAHPLDSSKHTTNPASNNHHHGSALTGSTATGREHGAPPRKEGVYEAGGVGGAGAANGGLNISVPKSNAQGAERYYSAGGVGGGVGFNSDERTNAYPEQRHAGEPLHPGVNAGKVQKEHELADNHNDNTETGRKPSTSDKIKGNIEKLAGKITGNEAKVAEGENIAHGRA